MCVCAVGGYPPQAPGSGGCPPGVDPNVYSWFMTVDADRSGQITAVELQQALTNGNWSHFNPEACRLMIGMYMYVILQIRHIRTQAAAPHNPSVEMFLYCGTVNHKDLPLKEIDLRGL